MPTLAGLAASVAAGELTVEQAEVALRAEGFDAGGLERLLEGLDQVLGRPSDEQFAGARIAYDVVDLVPDRRTAAVVVAAWARLLMYAGELDEAGRVVREADARGREVPDMRLRAMIASLLASVAMSAGSDEAIEARRRSVRMALEVGDPHLIAVEQIALGSQLGAASVSEGNLDRGKDVAEEADDHLRAAVDTARQAGLHDDEAQGLLVLAQQAERREDPVATAELLDAAAAAALAATGDSWGLLEVVGRIVNMKYRLGRAHRFADLLRLGEGLADRLDAIDLQIGYLSNLGLTEDAAGHHEDAVRLLREARILALVSGDDVAVARVEEDLARIGAPDGPAAPGPSPARSGTVTEQVSALADEVIAGRLDINAAIGRVTPPPNPSTAVQELLDLADRADADDRGQWAFAVTSLALFGIGLEIADPVRYRLLTQWGYFSQRAAAASDALWAYQQAAEVATRMGDPEMTVGALTNAGTVLRRAGRPAEAAVLYDRAVELAERCGPAVLAMAALNAGTAHGDLRQYARARDLYETALTVFERDPGTNGPQLATALLNHGETLIRLGDPAGAERQLHRALRLQREHGMTGQEGVTIGLLGHLRLDRGNVAAGLHHLERALEIAENEPDSWNAGLWALDLASLSAATGMPEAASAFYRRALDHSLRSHNRRTEAKARIGLAGDSATPFRDLLGIWRASRGFGGDDTVAARAALRLATAYTRMAFGEDDVVTAVEQGDLAIFHTAPVVRHQGALREAKRWLAAAGRVLAGAPHDDSLVVEAAVQRANLLRLTGRPRAALRALTVLRRTAATAAPTWTSPDGVIAGAIIAVLHRDLGRPRAARRYLDAAIEAAEAGVEALSSRTLRTAMRQRTALLYPRGVDCAMREGDVEGAYRYAERSKNLEGRRALRFRVDQASLDAPAPADLRDLAGELGNAVVVEFLPTATRLYAFLFAPSIPPGESVVAIDGLGLTELARLLWTPLETAYRRLKQPSSAFDPGALRAWQDAVTAACAEAGRLVLDPIARRIADRGLDSVIFVPHSVLHCLPLHACPIEGGEPWGDRYRISYAPSAAILAAVADAPVADDTRAGFADPTGDLPFSRIEAAITGAFVRSGARATPEALLDALQTTSHLHVACHASHGADSSLLLAPGGEAGRLSVARIQRDTALRPGSIVYLSACETGTVTPGIDDEFTNLAGGMLFAGAASVIATHWRVRDACALIVADLFYAPGSPFPLAERLRRATRRARTMTEREVLERLALVCAAYPLLEDDRVEWLLRPYRQARDDHHPFREPADWAAFFLAGRP